eukprot:1186875-Ditylum_brightwellii.AAC.1
MKAVKQKSSCCIVLRGIEYVGIITDYQNRSSSLVQSTQTTSGWKLLKNVAKGPVEEPESSDCFEDYFNSDVCQKADEALIDKAHGLIRIVEQHLVLKGNKSPFVRVGA